MKRYDLKVLNLLIDKYERSKSFIGKNNQNQSFSIKLEEIFPGYADEAQYELFSEVNAQLEQLERDGLVTIRRSKRGRIDTDMIKSATLAVNNLDKCYVLLGRKPKADRNEEIRVLLNQYQDRTPLLKRFCGDQLTRLEENKKVQYSEDLEKLEQILKILNEIETVEEETFVRNFSIRVLGDSKAFEKIKAPVISILYEYGDYPDKECILQDLNIVKNPGYVYLKGNGRVTISGQVIDFNQLDGDMGISSSLLDNVEKVEVSAPRVITIENLTTYNTFHDNDAFVIYLGGYHNSIRRKLICKIYENNPDKSYYHYGDIDAGGFNILIDLRRKTGIPFIPLNMDVETIVKYKEYAKKLTENDKTRLRNLLGGEFDEIINYMLEHDCKLEQEAIE